MADPQWGGPLESFTHTGVAGVEGDGPHVQIWIRVEESFRVGEREKVGEWVKSRLMARSGSMRVSPFPVSIANEVGKGGGGLGAARKRLRPPLSCGRRTRSNGCPSSMAFGGSGDGGEGA